MAKNRGFYLLDKYHIKILGSKLPSNEQVLSVLLHHHIKLKKPLDESARNVVIEIVAFWNKARIPTRRNDKIQKKVLNLFQRWNSLKKNQSRTTKQQKENEALFRKELNNLFDVAHEEALKMIKIQEDKNFLIAQREPDRHGTMGGADISLAKSMNK